LSQIILITHHKRNLQKKLFVNGIKNDDNQIYSIIDSIFAI
jgi:hypothetical protein